ncbi:hypothetical protein BCR34DRAFT_482132 [Clohesyomyces aquaticus]|uniref:Uncharacterized protein n=1 Tax=Clohesyomyces aquaticus TaxID=1231657 RepID=A0A1Y1ZR25_9PLEO|nr:hypothetical protein BCR34DRAFT_482132 [Clohesyomyces aquaticus]
MPPTQLSAIYPSPKRKRDPPPYIPLLNTTLRPASPPPRAGSPTLAGSESPRTAVADQLRGMSIQQPIPMAPLTPTDDVVRKKPKLEVVRSDSGNSLDGFQGLDLGGEEKGKAYDQSVVVDAQSAEAGGEQKQSPDTCSHQQPRIWSDLKAFANKPTTFASSSSASASSSTQAHSYPNPRSRSKSRSGAQPRPRKKSPSPIGLASLTWQDSEITGHLVDPSTDPDDDGTGLNGIGFKPTPALAYARAQRRRQQLMEWRAREAREARAKRSERRRRGVGTGTGSRSGSREGSIAREAATTNVNEAEARRMVRFAA